MLSPCRRSSTQKARSAVKTDTSDVFPFFIPRASISSCISTPAILQLETSIVKMIRPELHGRPPRKNWSVPWVWALSAAPELSAWLVQDNVPHFVSKCAVSQGSGTSATSKRECSHRAALVSDWWPGWVRWGGRTHFGALIFAFPMLWQAVYGSFAFSHLLSLHFLLPPCLSRFSSPPPCWAFAERKRPKCHKRPRVAQFQTPGQHVFSEQECKKHCI